MLEEKDEVHNDLLNCAVNQLQFRKHSTICRYFNQTTFIR